MRSIGAAAAASAALVLVYVEDALDLLDGLPGF
jgi:hypothetical protein